MLAFLNSHMRLKSAAILSVLISSQAVAHSVVADLSDVPFALLFLDQVMLSGHVDGEVLENLWGETSALDCFETEGFDQLILRSKAFTSNVHHTDVYTSDELTNNKMVDGETGVVGVAVVEALVLWL
jgi:hypothetical protein